MNKNIKKINARTITLTILFVLILVVIALLIGKFSYSYLAPTVSDDVEGSGEVTASGDTIIFTKGNTLSLSANTDNFKTNGGNLTATTNPKVKLMASSKTNGASSKYYVGVHIKDNNYTYSTTSKTSEIILTIKDEKGNEVTSVGGLTYTTSGGVSGFDVTNKSGLYDIDLSHTIATTSSSSEIIHTWTFTLTFINLETDQSVNENSKMNIEIYLMKEKPISTVADVCSGEKTLASCVTTLKEKDTFGVANIYHHDGTLENGINDGSYRFAGTSEKVNNFVCFGSDAESCPTDNLYRIIGVIDGKVKLIKYDYATSTLLGIDGDYYGQYTTGSLNYKGNNYANISSYYWNNATQKNTWSESLLNKTNLNTNFITNIGSTWANKIAITTWKVGGNINSKIRDVVPSVSYQNEIVNPVTTNTTDNATEYVSRVGLMYVSDYGFAANPSFWTYPMRDSSDSPKDYRVATTANWMYMGLDEWTISRDANSMYGVLFVMNLGGVHSFNSKLTSAIRPSFYLESSVTYVSGSGTSTDPIRISL